MTTPQPLEPNVSITSFIAPGELARRAGGFRTIVNARPDGEEPDQPSSAAMAAVARQLGLEYVHIPVIPGQIGDEQVDMFARALAQSPGPVLAYCKSGMRAASLWALSRAHELGAEPVLAATARAGFDLRPLAPRLAGRAVG